MVFCQNYEIKFFPPTPKTSVSKINHLKISQLQKWAAKGRFAWEISWKTKSIFLHIQYGLFSLHQICLKQYNFQTDSCEEWLEHSVIWGDEKHWLSERSVLDPSGSWIEMDLFGIVIFTLLIQEELCITLNMQNSHCSVLKIYTQIFQMMANS